MKFHKDGTLPEDGSIFVFGSNLAGRHGAGAAKAALQFGAKYGIGNGLCSQSYAIPTKNEFIITMDLFSIQTYIDEFIGFVENNPDKEFFMTRIGCGLAGFNDSQIAPLFKRLSNFENISWPEPWAKYFY